MCVYGGIQGEVVVDMGFDEFMKEIVEQAFVDHDRADIEIEENFLDNLIYVKSTTLDSDNLIDILADNGIEARCR